MSAITSDELKGILKSMADDTNTQMKELMAEQTRQFKKQLAIANGARLEDPVFQVATKVLAFAASLVEANGKALPDLVTIVQQAALQGQEQDQSRSEIMEAIAKKCAEMWPKEGAEAASLSVKLEDHRRSPVAGRKRSRPQSCGYCGASGHSADTCWERHPDLRPRERSSRPSAHAKRDRDR